MVKRLFRILALVLLTQALVFAAPSARAETAASLADSLKLSSGRATVAWTVAGEDCPLYRVLFRLLESGKAQQALYTAAETDGHSAVTADLLPGKKYRIYLTDGSGKILDAKTYKMPSQPKFSLGKLTEKSVTVDISPMTLKAGGDRAKDARKVSRLSADSIRTWLDTGEGDSFGIRYNIRILRQKEELKPLLVTIAFEAPNGYACTAVADEFPFERVAYGYHHLTFHMLGEAFFRDLYSLNGTVPAGKYLIQLYLNGMWAHTAVFNVV